MRGISSFEYSLRRHRLSSDVLEAILYIPYCAQIAYGWTRLAVVMRALSLVLCLGFIILMVPIHGALAAAWSWSLR